MKSRRIDTASNFLYTAGTGHVRENGRSVNFTTKKQEKDRYDFDNTSHNTVAGSIFKSPFVPDKPRKEDSAEEILERINLRNEQIKNAKHRKKNKQATKTQTSCNTSKKSKLYTPWLNHTEKNDISVLTVKKTEVVDDKNKALKTSKQVKTPQEQEKTPYAVSVIGNLLFIHRDKNPTIKTLYAYSLNGEWSEYQGPPIHLDEHPKVYAKYKDTKNNVYSSVVCLP